MVVHTISLLVQFPEKSNPVWVINTKALRISNEDKHSRVIYSVNRSFHICLAEMLLKLYVEC